MNSHDFSTARWRKSSHSSGEGGQCVELAELDMVIGIRDSKNPGGPILEFTPAEFATLIAAVKTA